MAGWENVCIFAASFRPVSARARGWATESSKRKKTLLTAFICGIQNLVNSLIYRTVKACCDVHRWNIYTVTICVYVQRGHRALLILGRWAYQSLVCGISGRKLDSRASFLFPPHETRKPIGDSGSRAEKRDKLEVAPDTYKGIM